VLKVSTKFEIVFLGRIKNKKELVGVRICFLSLQLKGIPLTSQRVFVYPI
jgi:hypothetical protein